MLFGDEDVHGEMTRTDLKSIGTWWCETCLRQARGLYHIPRMGAWPSSGPEIHKGWQLRAAFYLPLTSKVFVRDFATSETLCRETKGGQLPNFKLCTRSTFALRDELQQEVVSWCLMCRPTVGLLDFHLKLRVVESLAGMPLWPCSTSRLAHGTWKKGVRLPGTESTVLSINAEKTLHHLRVDTKDYIMNPRFTLLVQKSKLHPRRPQTVGGFKKCFEEQAQAHEKALRTPNSTLFGSQDGRQDLGKADTPSNTKADLKKILRTPDSTQFVEKTNWDHPPQRETRRQTSWETRETRETRPWEGGHTIQDRHTCGGDNQRQWETLGHGETMGEKADTPSKPEIPSNRRQWEGDNERQDLGKEDTSSNTGTHVGRQWETMGHKGRQWEAMRNNGRQWNTRGDKVWEKKGDNGRQAETRPREGGHTIQHRRTCGETIDNWKQGADTGTCGETMGDIGDKGRHLAKRTHHPTHLHLWGRQWETREDKKWEAREARETRGDKGRQDLGKADIPSNTGTHVGK